MSIAAVGGVFALHNAGPLFEALASKPYSIALAIIHGMLCSGFALHDIAEAIELNFEAKASKS